MRGDLFEDPQVGIQEGWRRVAEAKRGVMQDPPQGRPENRKYEIKDIDVLTQEVHARIFQVLTVSAVPKFDKPPPRHWLARQCDRAAAVGDAKFYGNDYDRVRICVCGRAQAWPTWSETPRSQWLGRSGWRGRASWSKREVVTGGGPLFGNRGLTVWRVIVLIAIGVVVFAAYDSGALDQLLGK